LSLHPGFITLFYFPTIDITLSMSGDGYSCCTRLCRTCSSRVTLCARGHGSSVWVRKDVLHAVDRRANHCCPGREQTLLQTLLLPLCTLPVLLPTPLLEPRYFLIPYILLRAQLVDVTTWGLLLEGLWYGLINAGTMYVFLYKEREGVGRFMW
jgi:hypothetical protein